MADRSDVELELLKKDVQTVYGRVDRLEDEVSNFVSLLRTTLYGNGNPDKIGLVGRMKNIEDWMNEERDARMWFNRLVIGTTVAELIALLFLLARSFM